MNIPTKISLSKFETELVQNKDWILTKRRIIDKVYALFAQCHKDYRKWLADWNISLVDADPERAAKIAKGENYEGLPYVMMDYPAQFKKGNIMAIRTFFWWGHFFSISLHQSGINNQMNENTAPKLEYLVRKNFYVCVNDQEWQHGFDPLNYLPAEEIDHKKFDQILRRDFFKIAKKIPLNQWDDAPEFLTKTFVEMIQFLAISSPGGETDLSPGFPKVDSGL
jgi:hypothetical protein